MRSFIFQSTLPAWGATPQVSTRLSASHDFNPRSPRGERPRRSRCSKIRSNFNPRSPRGERHTSQDFGITDMQFQSTLPAWGATEAPARLLRLRDFNPRSPRGERRRQKSGGRAWENFNPRSPRGERREATIFLVTAGRFQSTLPAWGATYRSSLSSLSVQFQSTLPAWGATFVVVFIMIASLVFQSTLPAWGATVREQRCLGHEQISIHAPRVGSDCPHCGTKHDRDDFNPRSPRGERQCTLLYYTMSVISIHAPRVGSDDCPFLHKDGAHISIHAPRVGSDHGHISCNTFS